MHKLLSRFTTIASAAVLIGGGLALANPTTAGAARSDGMTVLSTGRHVPYLDHGAWISRHDGILASGLTGSYGSGSLAAHGSGPEVELGSPKVYLIFWGSQWGTQGSDASANATFSADTAGMAPRLQQLLTGIGGGGETWSGVMTQYCDGVSSGTTVCPPGASHVGAPASGGALAGVWYDSASAAPSSASSTQIAQEALNAAVHFNQSSTDQSAQYVVVSPSGTHPDGFNTPSGGFCAWHSYATSSSGFGFAFTNLPYVPDLGASCGANYVNAGAAGTLDGVSIVEGHEYAETLTDENAGGGWFDSQGYENGDKCAWNGSGTAAWNAQDVNFGTGSFAMQATWSNAAGGCQISGAYWTNPSSDFSISATSPVSVSAGSQATATVSTTVTAGVSQAVSLTASGLPSGANASFSPSSVSSGASSTMTISTSSSTPAGSYAITVTGAAASGSHSTTMTLSVTAPLQSDFSIHAISPVSVSAGSQATATVSTTVTAGVSQAVSLTASGLPSGANASFSPSSVSSGASSTMTISTSSSTPAGSYAITVTGAAASGSHSTTMTLSVTAPVKNAFSLSLSPTSGTATRGASSILTTVKTTTISGSAQKVSLSLSSAPNGVTLRLASFTLSSGQSTTLSFSASKRAATGTYAITVTGRATSGTVTASYLLTVK